MVQPFILRRPKDSPEVELELPKITVTKEYCQLTLEQASLYQATVDRWMPRIEEHERSFGRRGAVLAMLEPAEAGLQPPGDGRSPTGRPLAGRSGKLERLVELLEAMPADDKALVFTQYPGFDRLVPHLQRRLGRAIGFFHGGLAARAARASSSTRSRPTRRAVDPGDLDSRGRPRPQPARGEPRLPLRPLVEPRRRAAGDRPRVPVRPAQGRSSSTASSARRRSRSGSTSCSTRSASWPRRSSPAAPTTGSASSTSTRSAPPCRSPTTPSRRRHDARRRGTPDLRHGDDDRIGRGPWARWVATAVVAGRASTARRAGPDARARRGTSTASRIVPGRDLGARDRLERRRVRASAWRPHRCRRASGRP